MQLIWLTLAIAATVAYHVVLKMTPAGANPLLSLMVTYGAVALLFAGALVLSPGEFAWRDEIRQLNWTAIALALAIIGLDLGFILLYRRGSRSASARWSRRRRPRCCWSESACWSSAKS